MSYADFFTFQRIKTLVNMALITFVAYFGVSFFYQMVGMQFRPAEQSAEASAKAGSTRPALTRQAFAHYRPVLDRDLFNTGKTAQAIDTTKPDPGTMEETKLELKLWGTVSGDDKKALYAVIEDTKKREQNLYRVGDTVQNATVKMVMREVVILSVNGKDEKLEMEKLEQAGRPGSTGRRPSYASRGSARPMVPQGRPREQRITLQRNAVDAALQDMGSLMTQIHIQPSDDGLSVSRIKANSIFRRLGLRNGDVLTGINGQEIKSVDDAMSMYQNLKSSDELSLKIKRRGQERTINYNIR